MPTRQERIAPFVMTLVYYGMAYYLLRQTPLHPAMHATFVGALAALLAGTVVVEKVFAIPGLGNIFIQSIFNRDEPLILGIVAFLSILIMIFNLLVDISYAFLDPRIRYE